MTERHEIEAWLGDESDLTGEQVTRLTAITGEIAARYPDPDDGDEREAALTVAYRVMAGDDPVGELGEQLLAARLAEARALAGLHQVALMLAEVGESEAGFARRGGIDRMLVRKWLGKRP